MATRNPVRFPTWETGAKKTRNVNNGDFQLPISTGEFTGILHHQQYDYHDVNHIPTHRIHGTNGIFTYISLMFMVH